MIIDSNNKKKKCDLIALKILKIIVLLEIIEDYFLVN